MLQDNLNTRDLEDDHISDMVMLMFPAWDGFNQVSKEELALADQPRIFSLQKLVEAYLTRDFIHQVFEHLWIP